jgi:hypothetical protein
MYQIPPMTASNAMAPPTTPPTIGAVLEDDDPPPLLWFKEGEGALDTTVDDGGKVDVRTTWVVTMLPSDKVVKEEDDRSVKSDVEAGVDDAEVGVDCGA